ncbi:MAG: hypothetical protein U0169_25335 [Polyangiaceae bacterium]
MNFLLHYRRATAASGSRRTGVGAMLPDLWRMADRRVRPVPNDGGGPVVTAGPDIDDVEAGVRMHLDDDLWFHATDVFRSGEAATLAAFRAVTFDAAPRLVLFAHVAWELCLDGALVRREGAPALRAEIARAVGTKGDDERSAFARVAERHHFARVPRTDDERRAFDGTMERILDGLADGPWIADYAEGRGVAARIDGIRRRFAFPALSDVDRQRLADVFDARIEAAGLVLDALTG